MGRGAVRGGITGTACAKEWNDAWVRATSVHSQQVLQQPWLNTHLASDRNGRNTKFPFEDAHALTHNLGHLHRHVPILVFLKCLASALQMDVAGT